MLLPRPCMSDLLWHWIWLDSHLNEPLHRCWTTDEMLTSDVTYKTVHVLPNNWKWCNLYIYRKQGQIKCTDNPTSASCHLLAPITVICSIPVGCLLIWWSSAVKYTGQNSCRELRWNDSMCVCLPATINQNTSSLACSFMREAPAASRERTDFPTSFPHTVFTLTLNTNISITDLTSTCGQCVCVCPRVCIQYL